ncbi:MOSC domain-containing protein [Egicoccus sp. AB-alg6-2]|uniref:MOSC domain-containing protein n=1 Tax=Egicoccus sp. AB-alg6-2 TaxID=3242692 RepID=UPI00359D5C79
MSTPPSVLAICVGRSRPFGDRAVGRTAIDKRPVEGPVVAGDDGLAGDEQADLRHHGGPDQALYVYAQEDADAWSADLGRVVAAGSFGENLRTSGLEVSRARIGEVWRVGACTVQVTGPRLPCRTFAAFWDVPDLVPRFLAAGRPGAYLRVLVEGPMQAGDTIEVLERPDTTLLVADVARIVTRDRHDAALLLPSDALGERIRRWARARTGEPTAEPSPS